jgi:hypothetical protein
MLTTETPIIRILVDTLESYLSSNTLSNILSSFDGTGILGQLLGGGGARGNSSGSLSWLRVFLLANLLRGIKLAYINRVNFYRNRNLIIN